MLKLEICSDDISLKIKEIAKEIDSRMRLENISHLDVVWILEGARYFAKDLIAQLKTPYTEHSIKISSYKNNVKQKKIPELIGNMCDVREKTVLLIDDILDTGDTAAFTKQMLENAGAKKVFTCFFLDKKNGISKSIIPDFKCFDIENFYVVGYGLDDNGKNRDLKAIYSKT